MGAKLEAYFDMAKDKGGATAQMKLAMLTKMSPKKAKEAEDNDANVAVFDKAVERLKEQGVI